MMADIEPRAKVAVHKFGGSSLADPGCYRRVAEILLSHSASQDPVVVSAAGKTTNKLLKLKELHQQGRDLSALMGQLADYQIHLIRELIARPQPLLADLDEDLKLLARWLAEPSLTPCLANRIVALGECWSSRLLAAVLTQAGRPARALDAREFLLAKGEYNPQIEEQPSRQRLQQYLEPGVQLVVTGFICADNQGETLLLGRNGSDYSATLVAKLAEAGEVNIWTDVAGVYSADPNLIPEARLIEELSLAEATELGRLGNPVLHWRTLQPLVQNQIALRVRSSFDPHCSYTEIGRRLGHVGDCIVNGVASVVLFHLKAEPDNLALAQQQLNEQGLFALTSSRVNEQLVLSYTTERAHAVEQCLLEIEGLQWQRDCTHGLVSLLDAGVSPYRALYTKLLKPESSYPVILSENGLSISGLVKRERVSLLSHLLHHNIYRPVKRVGVILFGAGNIGTAWLELFAIQQQQLEAKFSVSLSLAGIVRSQSALIDFDGIEVSQWQVKYSQEGRSWSYPELLSQLKQHPFDELVVLDISASEQLSEHYPALFDLGSHMISASKIAGSASSPFYNRVRHCQRANGVLWHSNASVGAGLPIQYALSDLRAGGDQLQSISGVFSGTLSWLFEHYNGDEAFSELVLKARALGITEPDPRDDLSGKDMQRKLLILAREAGVSIDLEEIALESMVPEALTELPLAQFLDQISALDAPLAALYHQAQQQNCVLRYVASVELGGVASVGLQMLPRQHPFANLTPSDNVFMISSRWYQSNPLVIRGPGAGREVTAAAVQSDLFQVVAHLAS